MKRILHISKYYYPFSGGIEQIARDCVNVLKDEYEQMVIAFSENEKDENTVVDGVTVYKCGCRKKIASQPISYTYKRRLKKVINDFKPNIVVFHYPNPFVASILLPLIEKNNIKLVTYWHCDIVKQKIIGKFFIGQNKKILKMSTKIIVTSPNYIEGSDWLKYAKEKCCVIPNCINTERMSVTPKIEKMAEEIRKKNANKVICLAVGRHTKYKGFEYLIKASKLLPNNYTIYIAGTGELTNKLHKEAKGDLKICFTGRVDDDKLKALLLACDIFCFPSITKNEAFGVALAEAMYYGKPAVTFTIPGSGVNYVCINGETGIECENGNSKEFAKAIKRLGYNNEIRTTYGRASRQRVIHNFIQEIYKLHVIRLFENL